MQCVNWKIKNFTSLSTSELYQLLQLRTQVFVVEQNCVYQDIDGKDLLALHILGTIDKNICVYARVFKQGDYLEQASIARIVVAKQFRNLNYGHQLMDFCIKTISDKYQTNKIMISAQTYLQNFYQKHGFKAIGKGYLEDGIPHIRMLYEN